MWTIFHIRLPICVSHVILHVSIFVMKTKLFKRNWITNSVYISTVFRWSNMHLPPVDCEIDIWQQNNLLQGFLGLHNTILYDSIDFHIIFTSHSIHTGSGLIVTRVIVTVKV